MAQSDPHSQPAGFQGATPPHFGDVRIRNRGRLPHWERDAGLYFLTFHLADSLPKSVLKKIAERHQILGRSGRFWQREYYDHLLRNHVELDHAIRYVLDNPGKAGLSDWVWVWNSADSSLSLPQDRKS